MISNHQKCENNNLFLLGWQFEIRARCKSSNRRIGSWQFLSDWPTTMAASTFVSDAVSTKSFGINVCHNGKHPEHDAKSWRYERRLERCQKGW